MQKIFSLTTRDFATGYTKYGDYLSKGGLFTDARGIQLFDSINGQFNGVIRAGDEGTERGAGTVADDSLAGTTRITGASTGNAYIIGNSGNFYDYDLSDNSVSNLRSGNLISEASNGLEIFQPTGGTEYLYYWQDQDIGRWDLSGTFPTGWDDDWATTVSDDTTALQDVPYHPTHKFLRGIWYGNGDRLGSIEDDLAADVTHSTNVLDFPSTFTVTAITNDGFYLVVALNQNSGDGRLFAPPKIIFWNTFGSTWQREWDIPSAAIYAIESVGSVIYIVASDGIYFCTFNQEPKMLFPMRVTSGGSNIFRSSNAITRFKNGILFDIPQFSTVAGTPGLQYFGEIVPGGGAIYYTPTTQIESTVNTFVLKITDNSILIGDGSDNLYSVNVLGTATSITSTVTAESKYIDLQGKWDVKRIDVTTAEPIGANDEINIDVQFDEDTAAVDWGTINNTDYNSKRRISLYDKAGKANGVTMMKTLINLVGGNPKIARIDVYGNRTDDQN